MENQVVLLGYTQELNSINNILKEDVICISCSAASMKTNLNESFSTSGMCWTNYICTTCRIFLQQINQQNNT
jgi:hypothetical protein